LAWNVVGVVVLAITAVAAGSVALAGFGLDSFIEIGASSVVIWELNGTGAARQSRALRLIAVAFIALAVYLVFQSTWVLATNHQAAHSPAGILWTDRERRGGGVCGQTLSAIARSRVTTASVFAARDATVDEPAQQAPLVRFEVLTLVRAGDLRAAGFRLEPTGRNPGITPSPSTTSMPGVSALEACEHRSWPNPYRED
jgi:hypothetical protein